MPLLDFEIKLSKKIPSAQEIYFLLPFYKVFY